MEEKKANMWHGREKANMWHGREKKLICGMEEKNVVVYGSCGRNKK